MPGFVTDSAQYLALTLYVHIIVLVFGGRYINDASGLAIALGLASIHGGWVELLQVFLGLSVLLLPVDIFIMIHDGLKGWLMFLLIVVIITRAGSVWFSYRVYNEHKDAQPPSTFDAGPEVFIPQQGGSSEQQGALNP